MVRHALYGCIHLSLKKHEFPGESARTASRAWVVGDHDPSRTLTLIEAHYGHLPARPVPPEPTVVEPPQTAERRDRVFRSSNPQAVMWGYRAPAARALGHRDRPITLDYA